MASTPVGSNALILEVLNRNNYKDWRPRLKTYLLAKDLWEVIEAIKKPAELEDNEAEYKAWTKKNAEALYVIQNSCGREMFSFIREIETARTAWKTLEQECKVLQGYDENNADHIYRHMSFTKFVSNGDWDKAKECLGEVDVRSIARVLMNPRDDFGDVALHVAARKGHVHIVKELVQLLTLEDLKTKNAYAFTALHIVVMEGHAHIVKELRPWSMGDVKDGDGDTALHKAINNERLDIVKELVLLMRSEDLKIKNDDGYTAFHLAVNKGNMPIVKEFVTKEEGENNIAKDNFDRYISFTTYVTNGDWDNANKCLRELNDPCSAITVVDPRNQYGDTALHVAAAKGHEHILKELVSLLKVRQEQNLELKTDQDFTTFGSGINLGISEEVVMERAKYMVEQYKKTLSSILDVQNAKGSTTLHLAVLNGNVDTVKELVVLMRQESLEIKDNEGSNALHVAVQNGHMHIVKELMPLMRPEAMEEKNNEGYTALGCALIVGKDEDAMEMAKYMAEKYNKVFGIPMPPHDDIPVVWACVEVKWDLCRYLYSLTPLEFLMPEYGIDGTGLIILCLRARKLDIALDLLHRCPRLAISPTGYEWCPIIELAGMHSAFLSGTQLGFWQKFIYNRMHIEPANLSIHDTCINISKQDDDRHNQMNLNRSVICLYRELVNGLRKLSGVNRLRNMKWIHTRSIDILRCISEMVEKDNLTLTKFNIVKTSIFKAVKHGHVEFVTHMCQAHPQFADSLEESKNIFQFAIECRQNKIYSLIHGLDEEDQRYISSRAAKFPENMLHLAGNLSPLSMLNRISGAALQMQRELQWFKEVENIVPQQMHGILNLDGMTPHELFTKNHEKLKKEAENSMKGTATSCTTVGALIVTIMFAVAFTVPGGNNGSTGAPMFLHEKLFLVFIISDTLSLISSTTSVILFLGILTSRYAEEDFLKNLPKKMMIGLSTLFLSIATMMIAFSCALIIMLEKKYSWAIIPSIFATSIPVASFIWLQFPLLVEIFWSTYGPGIFDKNVERLVKL